MNRSTPDVHQRNTFIYVTQLCTYKIKLSSY
nr:MAG TPA: hypothetical protein [Caudoviricetes sp.]